MKEFDELVDIIATLRGKNGCDWDKKQTMASMKKYILEEVYELFEAVEKEDIQEIKEELGDISMHMVFLTRIAQEQGWFKIKDVLRSINEKLIFRHPHVFENEKVEGVKDILKNWEKLKQKEKKERQFLLDGVPAALPSILRSLKIQEKLTRVGFQWDDVNGIMDKVEEEMEEMKVEVRENKMDRVEEELGDVFFVLVNLALKLGIDPESALQKTNNKVIQRFRYIEEELSKLGKNLESASVGEMEAFWQSAKQEKERG
jgi:tetrapyrrole methylase family protein/MazG family protein